KISSRFNNKENSFWTTDLKVISFEKIRETAFRPWAVNTIPRRFCIGMVEVSDGRKHVIHYSIAEDTGMVGATWGVEWCVVGLDRNWAYNPACQMARPCSACCRRRERRRHELSHSRLRQTEIALR